MRQESKICKAPWGCKKPTAREAGHHVRHVAGLPFCRDCYQYTFEQAHKRNLSPAQWPELIKTLPAPLLQPPEYEMRCGGPGCGEVLPAKSKAKIRRFVGRRLDGKGIPACRSCYQRAFEYMEAHSGLTHEEAFKKMPPRQRRTS